MLGVLGGFAVVGAVIVIGYVAGRLVIGGPQAGFALNQMAFFVTNPALLFTVLADADLGSVFSEYMPIALISSLAIAVLYVLISRFLFRRPAAETAIGAMASSYVNANNIGIPIALYALGDATPVAPVLLVQLLLLAPLYLTVLDLTSSRKPSFRAFLTQPFRNPMIIASLLGVAVAATGFRPPGPVWDSLVLLGGAAVPMVLLSFGMSLPGSRPLRRSPDRLQVLTATALKSALMPVVAYLTAHHLFGLDGHKLLAAVVVSALPTAQNVFMFASRYGRGIPLARDTVLLSSVLAIPALIVVAALLA
ncbi:AEC family transporter [Arthrobacter burdickii]|jgi:malonate transporter|uniref:AEC family transporter n=1 Tax=Arthrobacter burdickii TaxID=3035920 RepID=A0ABT8JXW5_9MICC|nr:AEC family transporter [Arthrobacter burdickii]MDN4609421.1 AEC family transporter [Arthrobacter burdickii]